MQMSFHCSRLTEKLPCLISLTTYRLKATLEVWTSSTQRLTRNLPKPRARRLSRSTWLSQEHHCGEWGSEADFARHIVKECCNLGKMMGSLANYFDNKAFARELFNRDYNMGANSHVSHRILPLQPLSITVFSKGKALDVFT